MRFEPFDLLERVMAGHASAKYDLSSSDMPPQRLADVGGLEDLSLAENHVGGSPALREQLARRFGGRPEDYIATAGTSEANFAVFASLLKPGDPVLIEQPTYQPLLEIPRGLSAKVHRLVRPEGRQYGLDIDAVRKAMPKGLRLLVLANLHNPSGAAVDGKAMRAIADLAAQEGFYVLVDEIFRELAIDAIPPTAGGLNDRMIVTASVTKYYGAGGLKVGWLRAAPETRALVRRTLDYMSVSPPGPSERLATALLREHARTTERNRRLLQEGRKIVADWVATVPEVHYTQPPGHICFPRVDVDSDGLSRRLLDKYNTFLAPGESFGEPGHFRLNLGRGPEQLKGGLARVAQALRES